MIPILLTGLISAFCGLHNANLEISVLHFANIFNAFGTCFVPEISILLKYQPLFKAFSVRTLEFTETCTILARPLQSVFTKMQWTDLLIIYLSCGAPFGVYFFLQHRKKGISIRLLLRSAAAGLVWIAYAYLLWRKNVAKRLTSQKKSLQKSLQNFLPDPEIALLEQQTSVLQEQVLQAFIELNSNARLKAQFFAFRDVLERFVGLTLAVKADQSAGIGSGAEKNDHELFRIAGRKGKDAALAQKCLSRRNRLRLEEHQKNAREDFLKQVANLAGAGVLINGGGRGQNISLIKDLILELLELIDVKLMGRAEEIFAGAETAPATLANIKVNGFSKPQEKIEVIPCQPQAQPQPQTQPLRTTLLQRQSAD